MKHGVLSSTLTSHPSTGHAPPQRLRNASVTPVTRTSLSNATIICSALDRCAVPSWRYEIWGCGGGERRAEINVIEEGHHCKDTTPPDHAPIDHPATTPTAVESPPACPAPLPPLHPPPPPFRPPPSPPPPPPPAPPPSPPPPAPLPPPSSPPPSPPHSRSGRAVHTHLAADLVGAVELDEVDLGGAERRESILGHDLRADLPRNARLRWSRVGARVWGWRGKRETTDER